MKKILKLSLSVIIISIILVSLSGCKKNETEKELLEKKVNIEISYIDSELISMANELNNIDYNKYKVVEKKVESTDKSDEGNESNEKESKNKSSQESQGSSDGGSQESNAESSSKSEKQGEASDSTNKIFSIQSNNILGKTSDEINWNQLKNKIENLYVTWTTVSEDLRKIGISEGELNEFANKIDFVALAIKSEDKNETMTNIIELYKFLPDFVGVYEDDVKGKNVLYTKYNLLVCYKCADSENWDELQSSLSDLKMSFSNISNQKGEYSGKDINITNASVIINEMNNTINIKEKDIFFIKYKNLMQELNIMLEI